MNENDLEPRLRESPETPPSLQDALEARAESRMPPQLRANREERLGPLFDPPGGPGGSGGASPAPTSGWPPSAWAGVAAAALAILVSVGWMATRPASRSPAEEPAGSGSSPALAGSADRSGRESAGREPSEPMEPSERSASGAERPAEPPPSEPPPAEPPLGAGEPSETARERAPAASARLQRPRPQPAPLSSPRSSPTEVEDEIALIDRAQRQLASSPARSLETLAEHRTRFPRGLLGQEREALAVEALLRTGDLAAARSRARRFLRRHEGSALAERIRQLIRDEP